MKISPLKAELYPIVLDDMTEKFIAASEALMGFDTYLSEEELVIILDIAKAKASSPTIKSGRFFA